MWSECQLWLEYICRQHVYMNMGTKTNLVPCIIGPWLCWKTVNVCLLQVGVSDVSPHTLLFIIIHHCQCDNMLTNEQTNTFHRALAYRLYCENVNLFTSGIWTRYTWETHVFILRDRLTNTFPDSIAKQLCCRNVNVFTEVVVFKSIFFLWQTYMHINLHRINL